MSEYNYRDLQDTQCVEQAVKAALQKARNAKFDFEFWIGNKYFLPIDKEIITGLYNDSEFFKRASIGLADPMTVGTEVWRDRDWLQKLIDDIKGAIKIAHPEWYTPNGGGK